MLGRAVSGRRICASIVNKLAPKDLVVDVSLSRNGLKECDQLRLCRHRDEMRIDFLTCVRPRVPNALFSSDDYGRSALDETAFDVYFNPAPHAFTLTPGPGGFHAFFLLDVPFLKSAQSSQSLFWTLKARPEDGR
jgi:hypothetical protein